MIARRALFAFATWLARRAVGRHNIEDFVGPPPHPRYAAAVEVDFTYGGVMVWSWPLGWIDVRPKR